jgi:hypothetical protein
MNGPPTSQRRITSIHRPITKISASHACDLRKMAQPGNQRADAACVTFGGDSDADKFTCSENAANANTAKASSKPRLFATKRIITGPNSTREAK